MIERRLKRHVALAQFASRPRPPAPPGDAALPAPVALVVAVPQVARGGGGAPGEGESEPKRRKINLLQEDASPGTLILNKVSRGLLYATCAQELCKSIVEVYGDHSDLVSEIARTGTSGKHASNTLRDLLRKCGPNLLEPDFVSITVKSIHDHGTLTTAWPVLHPHEVFAAVSNQLPDAAFNKIFLGPDGEVGLEDFWERNRDKPWVVNHPGFNEAGPPPTNRCVPMYVHADAGQHIKRDKILCISYGSCMTIMHTLLGLLLFTIMQYDLLVPGVTDEQLYAVLIWSFYYLMLGIHPWRNHDGKEFKRGAHRII